MPQKRLYLDHAACAPMSPSAREAFQRVFDAGAGNAGSAHAEGRLMKDWLEAARSRVAKTLGARPREIVFTDGGTTAANLALQGAAYARHTVSTRVVLSAVEHPAVLEAADLLAMRGFELVHVPVDGTGRVDAGEFVRATDEGAAVAALMAANHETGTLMPVPEVAAALRERKIPLLCDAALAPGRIPCGVSDLGADLMAFSGYKFGGPPGSGALYVRRRVKLLRLLGGGAQEETLKPGAENVAACSAFSVALEEACAEQAKRAAAYDALGDTFLDALRAVDDWSLVGHGEHRLPGLMTLELGGVEGEAAMINLDLEGIAVATGSTCALGGADPSPSLLAMGFSKRRAAMTIRISVGEGTSIEEVKHAAATLARVVNRLRALARPS